ncbi:MAG: helix-turn-helix transcriptional regulator [Planctomycetota bacterium]
MKLADWLHARSMTPEQLRRMLGVKQRSTVMRYLTGDRTPSLELIQLILEITEEQVTLADFLDTSPPKCAEVVTDAKGDPKLVFPWSRGERQDAAYESMLRRPREGDHLSDPVTRAMEVLKGRTRFTKRGMFLLDGRLSDARRVVAEANRVLEAKGEPPIPYPGVHRRDS